MSRLAPAERRTQNLAPGMGAFKSSSKSKEGIIPANNFLIRNNQNQTHKTNKARAPMRLLLLVTLLGFAGLALADQQQDQPTPFRKDNTYTFQYNAQVCSGLIASSDEDAGEPQQKAATRIQAQAKITFTSDRHAQLQLQQIRVGQLNEQLEAPEKVQPMAIFEPKQMPSEKQRQLELPCQFSYADGVVERVQFHTDDDTWSQNLKRAVLNMIQLNLRKNNAQGLRAGDEQPEEQEDEQDENSALSKLSRSFSIPEITVEGACQTTYTINRAGQQQQQDKTAAFNVTKTINFKQCSKIADVAYGFQTEQPQAQCAQCQLYWFKKQQKQAEQQQPGEQHPCAKCDPKEVKEHMLDRSTVLRYQLACPSSNCEQDQKYAFKRTELLSQYVFKQTKAQNGKYSSAMHTVVAATLQFRSVGPKGSETVLNMSGSKDESLLYSNQRDAEVKRFYMFGDEEYPEASSSPFHQVPKVSQAEQALRKLAQTITGDKQKGIELQAGFELQRLVELLRMCTGQELKSIQQNVQNGQISAQMIPQEKQKAKHFFTDGLAICGTRNCVQQLAENIQNKQITQTKAVHALKTMTQVPAPSDQIVKIVERLCKHEKVHDQQPVKQACWLTFGALANELCQHKTQKGAQHSAFGVQSGFEKLELCPLDKKQQYKEAILELYKSAASTYDKVLALSALGNAGLDIAVGDIEQIVKDQSEARLVRCMAIDSLRRLRTQMPRKIQQILLPIYQNVREQPEVRSAAIAVLMGTKPEASFIDQIAYTVGKEPNRQVQAFVYRQMKAMAYSKSPMDQEIAKHIKNALKMANVDEQELRNSGKWQIPVFNEQLKEGWFIKLAQIVSPRSAMPAYLHAQVDSLFNDQFWAGTLKLFMAQQEAEDWIQDVMGTRQNVGQTRAERRTTDSDYGQSLRNIYSSLGIRSRRYWPLSSINGNNNDEESEQYAQNNRQPFAMLSVRIGDVDQGFVAIESNRNGRDNKFVEAIRQLLSGQIQFGRLFEQYQQGQQQQQMRGAIGTNMNEKKAIIPTSIGLPLRVHTSAPVLATIEGQGQVNTESASLESPLGAQVQINVHAMASVMHIQKMESTLPFLVSGVESIRSVEINLPLQYELNANQAQGVSLKLKLPRQRATILGFHSLPFTFTAQVDAKTQLQHEPRHVRAIHQPKLERMQHEVSRNYKATEQLGIPLHIQGHYHWPSQPTNYEQYLQMLMASENVLHLTYQPNEETPREAVFRISGSKFQKTSGQMPQMQDFYSSRIESAFDGQELDDMQTDNPVQRRQKLQTFLGRYQPEQQYRHSLKVSAQTVGGPKECRAQAEVATVCDAKVQSCQLQVEAQRSPIGGEGQKWTLKAQAQLIMPETVRSTEEITQLEQQKNNKFQCKATAEWGAEQKQKIAIRLQGEQARKRGQQSSRQQRQAFLNKYDLEADYQLKPETQNFFVRALELIKSKYYWNTESQLIGQERQGNSGKVLAGLVIDPITQKHANASIKTPGQVVRLQQFQLPMQSRPFSLVRPQQQSIHSINQFFQRIQTDRCAECTVDGQNVNTFDNADYSAPLFNKCYSVLAKDCSSEEPQFVVLMKTLGANGQKKLKVISQEIGQIECEPNSSSSGRQQQIVCKHNGNSVREDDDSDAVDFNNAQKSDVTIHLQGISVRFNGRKAWLKVSPMYKNGQCGLCGNYDDNSEDEWRMSNNQNTNNLVEFHRSYALKGNHDGEQCTDRELDDFYLQHGSTIRKAYRQQQQFNDVEGNSREDDQQDREQFDGRFDEDSDEWNDQEENNNNQQQRRQNKRRQTQVPVKKTKVLEMNHQICFSQEPVKQCPKGTVAIYANNNKQSQEDDEWDNDSNNNKDDDDRKNVRFTCLSRSSAEARRLLRQVRNGNSNSSVEEQLQKRDNSIAEKIREPKKCMRNRF